MSRNFKYILLGVVLVVVTCGLLSMLPPIRERLAWRVDLLRERIEYTFFPPDEELFVPVGEVAPTAAATLEVVSTQAASATPAPSLAPTLAPTVVTPTPGPTATPLPEKVLLEGVQYHDQHGLWNYCAPATLAMGLSYWGWDGDRLDTGKWLKPFDEDLNVMPYEMANYASQEAGLGALYRTGGTLELLKRLVAGGFPVLIEKGTLIRETTTGVITWMGHYNLIVGYDDATQEVITRDSYYSPPKYPLDYRIGYDLIMQEWQGFNYVFLVLYPPEREAEVMELLGSYADAAAANTAAAELASAEIYSMDGVQRFFAWYNRGTSLVAMQDYNGAAQAYDEGFKYLSSLPEDQVPKKIMRTVWYQTGPYFAYFYSGRYQDVINLADQVMTLPSKGPYLEESFYWRAQAKYAIGDTPGALDDLRKSLEYHPGFVPSVDFLAQLGYTE